MKHFINYMWDNDQRRIWAVILLAFPVLTICHSLAVEGEVYWLGAILVWIPLVIFLTYWVAEYFQSVK